VKRWLRQFLKLDARLSKAFLVGPEKTLISLILKVFAHSGDSWFWLIGLIIVWFFSNEEWQLRAGFLAVGLVLMAAAVIMIKFSIRRPRPDGEWGQIYRITDPHSFPSGHAARSAALAVMGAFIGPPWFSLVLAIWAPWVGISRIALGVHYLSDVLVGWIVGVLMGLLTLFLRPIAYQYLSLFL